mmetsp:Transcript_1353/g.4168  ORF Transcript_1353/g.4168 Transcript_1353/m.4168 type:complete len:184 (-) Transcript_1353:623-1174(-)
MHVEISAVHSRLLYSRCLNSTRRTSVQLSRTRFPAFRNQFYCTAGQEDYPPNLSKLIQSFSIVPDPMLRYKQLLFLAKKLPSFPEEQRVDDNKVHGCTSQVWIVVRVEDGVVYLSADSDSQLTKGLAALLVEGLSGGCVETILGLPMDFIQDFGLNQSLTPSRTSGFLNMFQLVKIKIAELQQ